MAWSWTYTELVQDSTDLIHLRSTFGEIKECIDQHCIPWKILSCLFCCRKRWCNRQWSGIRYFLWRGETSGWPCGIIWCTKGNSNSAGSLLWMWCHVNRALPGCCIVRHQTKYCMFCAYGLDTLADPEGTITDILNVLVQKWAVDMNEYACNSLKHNHPGTQVPVEIGKVPLSCIPSFWLCCIASFIN